MEHRITDTITRWVGISSLPLVIGAFVSGGAERGLGATVGAALAMINWLVVRWVVVQLVRRGDRGVPLMAVLVAKIGFVLAAAALLLRMFDATGLVLGVSALVAGIFGAALQLQLDGSLHTVATVARDGEPASERD